MPIYTYDCDSCGEVDHLHAVGADLHVCPGCGTPKFKRRGAYHVGFNETTIRHPAERAPRYNAWLNSDKVRGQLKRGELEPLRKHEDLAHDVPATNAAKESQSVVQKRMEGHLKEWHDKGQPDSKGVPQAGKKVKAKA